MFDYKLVDGKWVVTSKAKETYTAHSLITTILNFFYENKFSVDSNLVDYLAEGLSKHQAYINYGKDKSGKTVETPDFYRSSVVLMMDKAQSAAFCLAVEKAKEFYDPFDAKQQKEIEKYASAMLANFNALFEGKGGKPLPELPTEARVVEPYVNPKAIWSAIAERAVEAVVVGLPNLSCKALVRSEEDGRKLEGVIGLSGFIVVSEDKVLSQK